MRISKSKERDANWEIQCDYDKSTKVIVQDVQNKTLRK